MDIFGIGVHMLSLAQSYSQVARRTGRSTMLLDILKDGDRVVFADHREASRFARLCKERKLTVECITIPLEDYGMLQHKGRSIGRTLFDHTWLERFYQREIENAGRHIDQLQELASGDQSNLAPLPTYRPGGLWR